MATAPACASHPFKRRLTRDKVTARVRSTHPSARAGTGCVKYKCLFTSHWLRPARSIRTGLNVTPRRKRLQSAGKAGFRRYTSASPRRRSDLLARQAKRYGGRLWRSRTTGSLEGNLMNPAEPLLPDVFFKR